MKISSFKSRDSISYGKKYYNTDKIIRAFGEEIGESAKKNLIKKIEQANYKNSSLIYDAKNNIIEIKNKNNTVKNILSIPIDIANSLLSGLKNNKITKNIPFLDAISEAKVLKNRRIELENFANVASIEKCLNSFDGEKFSPDFFRNIHSRLSLKVGNYDSSFEKALTRLCTGIVPAFFLANDAYNLSMYVSNDKKLAESAHKRRFIQEISRIGMTSASMLLALKAFSKAGNKSADAVTYIITAVTVLSEVLGRKLAGNPVWFLNKKSDIENYSKKRGINETLSEKNKNTLENKKDSVLNAKNVLKVLGAMIAVGFSADKISKIPSISKIKSNLISKYENFMKKDYKISQKEFNEIIGLLKKNGFDGLADKYNKIVSESAELKDNYIILGKTTNKAKYVPIHQILTFPARYAWSIVNFPYSKIIKPVSDKFMHKTVVKNSDKVSDIEILRNSLNMIKKNKNKENFSDILNKKLLSSLDYETKSSVSNASLSVRTKKVASVASSAFLIADNYNSVMIESKGENKELAVQKGKERAVQRFVRIVYGAFFTTLFNTIFETTYNSSLLGAQAVNIADSFVLETMERKAVGLPTKKSDRNAITVLENEYLNAKGLKGSFSRLMSKVTGKKTIAQRAAD